MPLPDRPGSEPKNVPGQLNIYDSVPGMERYRHIWRSNFVLVPRDSMPNAPRSARACVESDYPIV